MSVHRRYLLCGLLLGSPPPLLRQHGSGLQAFDLQGVEHRQLAQRLGGDGFGLWRECFFELSQERSHPLGLFDELLVSYCLVFDDPSVRVHLEYVFVEQQGASLLIEPWLIHQSSLLPHPYGGSTAFLSKVFVNTRRGGGSVPYDTKCCKVQTRRFM